MRAVVFNNNGNLLASGCENSIVSIWNIDSDEEIITLDGHYGTVYCVAFSPDDKYLASGCED